jgi:hypothetical protein
MAEEARLPRREVIKFWWQCAKVAGKQSSQFANDYQWLFGFPILAAILYVVSKWRGGAPLTISQDTAVGAFEAALIAFALTWLISFTWRVIEASANFHGSEKARADTLQAALDARPLEIVLRHSPSFLRSLLTFNKTTGERAAGNYWHIAVCNRTSDRTIRNVSLCVTQCSAHPIHRPFPLYLEGDTSNIPPQGHLLFVVASHMKNNDGTASPITLCNSEGTEALGDFYSGISVDSKSFDIEVQAFSETAHARQWFKLYLTPAGDLIIDPEVGSWDRRYEAPVMAFASMVPPKPKLEAE